MPPQGHRKYGAEYATVSDPRIEIITESGCWVWLAGCDKDGYGRVWRDGKTRKAHREFWEHANGTIAADLVVDHICRVRSCVNPDHLRLVDAITNVTVNSVSPFALNARRQHCLTCGGNLESVNWATKNRVCKRCSRRKCRSYYAARRARNGQPYSPKISDD